jgi:hypothetical protein
MELPTKSRKPHITALHGALDKAPVKQFNEPIPLPKGKPLVTLRDAANYVTKLPKAEHDAQEWQAAMEALLLVAEHGGPTMLARIGVMRALNRHVERVFDSSRKETHWGRRKLARDVLGSNLPYSSRSIPER